MNKNMGLNFSGDSGIADNRKVIIQSYSNDRSTDDVIQWINYLNPSIKTEKIFDTFQIDEVKIELSNSKSIFKLNDVIFSHEDSYWYRRGYLSILNTDSFISKNIQENNSLPILDFLNKKQISN